MLFYHKNGSFCHLHANHGGYVKDHTATQGLKGKEKWAFVRKCLLLTLEIRARCLLCECQRLYILKSDLTPFYTIANSCNSASNMGIWQLFY